MTYQDYESIGYHPQTYGHQKMIDRIIKQRGIAGAREYIKNLKKSEEKEEKVTKNVARKNDVNTL